MFLWGHVEEKIYIFTYRRRMNTKLGKKLTRCVRRFQTERRMNFWLLDNVKSRDSLKNLYLHFHKVYSH